MYPHRSIQARLSDELGFRFSQGNRWSASSAVERLLMPHIIPNRTLWGVNSTYSLVRQPAQVRFTRDGDINAHH